MSEKRRVFEEIGGLLPQKNATKLQPKRSINKLLDKLQTGSYNSLNKPDHCEERNNLTTLKEVFKEQCKKKTPTFMLESFLE
ncbi:hypothetical protein [uncultured Pedobacter sp.]|uniref:hypothetical protein n=1 Tax=uncultured Pedobacter sp. TaxID=246139 RepID=UPI00261B3558|nr:hypothetical protein [uncultured Pedobacter sp.]